MRNDSKNAIENKVPEVTLLFWILKILATTLGETGGDSLSMTLGLGYAVSSLIFMALFAITLAVQVRSHRYHPFAYWAVVVSTTTVGTTLSDYLDRTLGLGYVISSLLLFFGVLAVLYLWRRTAGRIPFENIVSRSDEIFYWVTILVSNTLGTALGDFAATSTGLGFERSALIFSGLILLIGVVTLIFKGISASGLFWSTYVLTRPLGATLGDTLTKSHVEGGLALGRIASSLAIGILLMAGILMSHRANQTSD